MSEDELDAIKKAIDHAKLYGLAPLRIESQRLAGSMNRADHQLGVKRARKWAMGDEYFIFATPQGPRIVMFN